MQPCMPTSLWERERKFLELSFLGANVPGSESSIPQNFRSRERKFLGAKVPVTSYTPNPNVTAQQLVEQSVLYVADWIGLIKPVVLLKC